MSHDEHTLFTQLPQLKSNGITHLWYDMETYFKRSNMLRLDHIALRCLDRHRTAKFYIDAFGYKVQTEFEISFEDGTKAKCIALEPHSNAIESPWFINHCEEEYHRPPEIFVSDGDENSIVGKWAAARGGAAIHHLAYQVDSVEQKMKEWKEKGYAEFTTDAPLICPNLVQIFTKPSILTGVIFEFIERGQRGFCQENVGLLMSSTAEFSNSLTPHQANT